MGRRGLLGGLGAAGVLAAPFAARAKLYSVERRRSFSFTLANGLQVVVLPSSRAPIVNQLLVYKVGGADEVWGKTGIAHFLEHMMFKGTASVGPTEFSRIVSRNGGRDNAYTGFDTTGYYQIVSPDRLEMVMRMEADRMAHLRITEKELIPEREVVLEERRMRIENSPGAMLSESVQEQLYGRRKPYGMPISGYPADVRKLGVGDLQAFYAKWYAPNNAVLIVAGDTTPEQVRKLAEKHYGPIARRKVEARRRPAEGAPDLPQRVTRADARVAEPRWSRYYLAPSYHKGETRHAYALQVLSRLLGGGETSRLWKSLVDERKLALSAWAGYSAASLGLSQFDIGVHPAADTPMAAIETAVGEILARLLDEGVTAAEVERTQNQLLAGAIYAQDSLQNGPRLYGGVLGIGGTIADIDAWPERIAAVTPVEVVAAARHVWRDGGMVTGLLTPQTGVR
ncbi:M16 family metallopeptidase [Reyranella sp.]|uniref:M16 family metallopeptidase n=1 Tax=Reyranella sp. TaxID=1929291 RepID=UPI003BA93BA2